MIKTNKTIGRELALQALYQKTVNSESKDSIYSLNQQLNNKENNSAVNFAQELFNGTYENIEAINNIIEKSTEQRKIDDITQIEKCIVQIGTYEMQNHISTPYKVIINEYTNLAKEFGSTDGYKFVNATLDKIRHDVR